MVFQLGAGADETLLGRAEAHLGLGARADAERDCREAQRWAQGDAAVDQVAEKLLAQVAAQQPQ